MQEQKQEQALTQIDIQLIALAKFRKIAENPAQAVKQRAGLSLIDNGVKRSITPEEFALAQINREGKLVVESGEVEIDPRIETEDKKAYGIHADGKSLYALSGICSIAMFDALEQIRVSKGDDEFAQSLEEHQGTINQTFSNLLSGVESLFNENTNMISGALMGKLDSEMNRLTALKEQGEKVDPNQPQEEQPKTSRFIVEEKGKSARKFEQAMKSLEEALKTMPEGDFKKSWTSKTNLLKADLKETADQIAAFEPNQARNVIRAKEVELSELTDSFAQQLNTLTNGIEQMKLAYKSCLAIENAQAILDANMPKKWGPFNALRELCATKLNSAKDELEELLKKFETCESDQERTKLSQEFETKLKAFEDIIENTISQEKESSSKWPHLLKAGAALTTAGLLFGGIGTATLATGLSTAVGFTLGNVIGLFMGSLAAASIGAAAAIAATVLSTYVFPALLVLTGLYALYKAYESIHMEKQAVLLEKVMKVPGLCDAQIFLESAKDIYRGVLKSNGQQPGLFENLWTTTPSSAPLPGEPEVQPVAPSVYTPPSSGYGSLG